MRTFFSSFLHTFHHTFKKVQMRSRHRIVSKDDPKYEKMPTDPLSFRSFSSQMRGGSHRDGDDANALSLKQKLLGPMLLLIGTISLTVFTLLELNVIDLHEKDQERGTKTATLVIGVLSFLPGAYATTVLVQVRRGAEGWSYEMLRDT
jgi:hypothetical protein